MGEVQGGHESVGAGEQSIAAELEQAAQYVPDMLGHISVGENMVALNSRGKTYPVRIPRPPIRSRQGDELCGRPSSHIAGRTKSL